MVEEETIDSGYEGYKVYVAPQGSLLWADFQTYQKLKLTDNEKAERYYRHSKTNWLSLLQEKLGAIVEDCFFHPTKGDFLVKIRTGSQPRFKTADAVTTPSKFNFDGVIAQVKDADIEKVIPLEKSEDFTKEIEEYIEKISTEEAQDDFFG